MNCPTPDRWPPRFVLGDRLEQLAFFCSPLSGRLDNARQEVQGEGISFIVGIAAELNEHCVDDRWCLQADRREIFCGQFRVGIRPIRVGRVSML